MGCGETAVTLRDSDDAGIGDDAEGMEVAEEVPGIEVDESLQKTQSEK